MTAPASIQSQPNKSPYAAHVLTRYAKRKRYELARIKHAGLLAPDSDLLLESLASYQRTTIPIRGPKVKLHLNYQCGRQASDSNDDFQHS